MALYLLFALSQDHPATDPAPLRRLLHTLLQVAAPYVVHYVEKAGETGDEATHSLAHTIKVRQIYIYKRELTTLHD